MSRISLTWWRNVDVNEMMPFTDEDKHFTLLQRVTPEFIPQKCGHSILRIWTRWTPASVVSFKRCHVMTSRDDVTVTSLPGLEISYISYFCSILQERVYGSRINDVTEWVVRTSAEGVDRGWLLDHSIIAAAIAQWRIVDEVHCVRVNSGQFRT